MKHDICFMNIKEEGVLSLALYQKWRYKKKTFNEIV